MAEREWQPGDVAIWARVNGAGDLLIFRDGWGYGGDDAGRWISSDEGEAYPPRDAALRPLVVIDPEDREAASRFANLIENCGEDTHCATYPCGSLSCWADRVQQALREFANPTPPDCGARLVMTPAHMAEKVEWVCDQAAEHDGPHRDDACATTWTAKP